VGQPGAVALAGALIGGLALVLVYWQFRRSTRARLAEQKRLQSSLEAELAARQTERTAAAAKAKAEAEAESAAKADYDAQIAANHARIARWEQRSPEQLEIAKTGIPATARIVAAGSTNRTFARNPLVEFTLEVQAPGGSYTVQLEFVVPLFNTSLFQRGATIDVRVDPKNRENVVFIF